MSSELERLDDEVRRLQEQRRLLQQQMHQDRIDGRTAPPLSQLTRTQKRYFLEPWFTTGGVASTGAATVSFLAGIWTPWTWRFISMGIVFIVIAGMLFSAKWWHQDANVRTEGELQAPKKPGSGYW